MVRKLFLYTFFLMLSMNQLSAQFYYGLQNEFGKNRVQYQPFDWTYYGFDRYQVYTYAGGDEIARYVARKVDDFLPALEKKLDFQTDELLQIMVYNTMGDYKQSNLGLSSDDSPNTGGITKLVGSKVSVYFNGSHADLDRQIKAGIAEALINDMMYGGRARDVIKNSTFLTLPDWFKQGLINYLSQGWNVDLDNQVVDGIENDRFYNFNKLNPQDALLAGHSLWNYIVDTYGESVIPNVLYMVKVSRSIENAFNFVLGANTRILTFEWIDSYARRSLTADTTRKIPNGENPIRKYKKSRTYYHARISPDGKKLIYNTIELSQHKVFLLDLESGKTKRIAKWEPKIERINDLSYPLLSWHPSGKVFSMIHEKKGIIYLTTYDLEEKTKYSKPITGIEKVIDFNYSADGKKLAMAAVEKGNGQSDIYVYQINAGGLEQITNDIWDERSPRFIKGGTQIAFSSNRVSDTLKSSDNAKVEYEQSPYHDIFIYDYLKKSKLLYRVTQTPLIHESNPGDYADGSFYYLSESNGIRNCFVAKLDSVISFVDTTEHYRYTFNPKAATNYKRNIDEMDIALRSNKVLERYFENGKEKFVISPMIPVKEINGLPLQNTQYRRMVMFAPKMPQTINTVVPKEKEKKKKQEDKNKIDIDTYTIGDDKNETKKEEPNKEILTGKKLPVNMPEKKEFRFPIQQNYYTNFSVDNITTQFDNSFLAQTYQRFTGYYINPGINGFFKIQLSDLFEDYRITGAFRIAGNLNNEFLLSVENRKKNIDKQLILHRQSFPSVSSDGSSLLKIHTHDAQFKLKIPFNEVSALKTTFTYRNDRTVYAATDDYNLPLRNRYDNWGGVKLEYIFDNTRPKGLNLYNGTRLKVFAEYWRLIDKKQYDLFVFGFDIRNYKKIHRNLIWANRLAGSTSQGTAKLCYYLGGVDGWFTPKFDNDINIIHPEEYGFQTIATNMRGFKQNVRNGNNFAVLNSELRWPIFKYLFNRPIRSDFINNFQIVGFMDLGSAWYGNNPLSEENTENKLYYVGNPITVVIIEPKQPIIMGYGLGLRSRLFGYFIRLDFAQGLDFNGNVSRLNYLSFTTDF